MDLEADRIVVRDREERGEDSEREGPLILVECHLVRLKKNNNTDQYRFLK